MSIFLSRFFYSFHFLISITVASLLAMQENPRKVTLQHACETLQNSIQNTFDVLKNRFDQAVEGITITELFVSKKEEEITPKEMGLYGDLFGKKQELLSFKSKIDALITMVENGFVQLFTKLCSNKQNESLRREIKRKEKIAIKTSTTGKCKCNVCTSEGHRKFLFKQ